MLKSLAGLLFVRATFDASAQAAMSPVIR